jgi:hypothetical protein
MKYKSKLVYLNCNRSNCTEQTSKTDENEGLFLLVLATEKEEAWKWQDPPRTSHRRHR